MKKLFSIMLACVMILSVATIAFADGIGWNDTTYTFSTEVSPEVVSAGEEVTISVYFKNTTTNCDSVYFEGGGGLSFFYEYNKDVLTFKSVTYQDVIPTANMVVPTTAGIGVDGKIKFIANPTSDMTVDTTKPVAVYTFVVASNAKPGEYSAFTEDNSSGAVVGDMMGQEAGEKIYADPVTFTVKGSTPEKPATAEIDAATVTKGTTAVGNDGTKYTDVPTYIGKVAISNIGSKKVVLTPVATLNGVAHTLKSAPTITFDDKTTLEEGKVEFKFALIGAPTTGVELTAKVDIVD